MKKLLLIPMLFLGICQLNAQIIITGVMYDPKGSDAPALGTTHPDGYAYKGGYEYMQFMATENIDFSVTPFSVVTCVNGGQTAGADPEGWAAGGARTFKFNLTSGTAAKGTYFYVGGPEKVIAGYSTVANVYTPSADISSLNWIRTIAYSNGAAAGDVVGDDFGSSTTGLMANSGNPIGVAVFAGTTVVEASVPIDAIFFTSANPINSTSKAATYNATLGYGYRIPNNDRYKQLNGATPQPFFGMGTNTFGYLQEVAAGYPNDSGNFLRLGGIYNNTTGNWETPRTSTHVTLFPSTGEIANSINELTTDATTLPVTLVSFSAKKENDGVTLTWVTASEQNNKEFTILRSVDGKKFNAIGTVSGNGTKLTTSNYSFIDKNAFAGVNYYKLVQTDNDGKKQESSVISATTDLKKTHLSVFVPAGNQAVNLNVFAVNAGKASVTLTDMNGRKLAALDANVSKGYNTVPVSISLSAGVYIASLRIGSEVIQSKFIVQ